MGVCRCAYGSVSGASFAPRSYAHVGRSPRSATRSRRFFAIVEHARGDRCTFDEMRTGLDHISFSVPASKLDDWQKRLREKASDSLSRPRPRPESWSSWSATRTTSRSRSSAAAPETRTSIARPSRAETRRHRSATYLTAARAKYPTRERERSSRPRPADRSVTGTDL